jgi:hypothetical protein
MAPVMPRIDGVELQQVGKGSRREAVTSGESLCRLGDKWLTGADAGQFDFPSGGKIRKVIYHLGGKQLT